MTTSASDQPVWSRDESKADSPAARIQEQIWVLQAKEGDHEAFGCLVEQYDRRLLYYLARFTGNPDRVLDVAQEVWLTAWRQLRSLRSPAAFKVWLYRIAHDKAVNVIRGENRRADVYDQWGEMQTVQTEDEELIRMKAESVHRALAVLSPEHRQVLILRFLEAMSLDEISEALRCSLGTVKSRLHYAKQALRAAIEASHE
jgi:RNA polymerase sigma-70 factor (ECF subfamily)